MRPSCRCGIFLQTFGVNKSVFVGIRIVVPAHATLHIAVAFVQGNGCGIRAANLQHGSLYAHLHADLQHETEKPLAKPLPAVIGMRGNVQDFQFVRGMVYGHVRDKSTMLPQAEYGKYMLLEGKTKLLFLPGHGKTTLFQFGDFGYMLRPELEEVRILRGNSCGCSLRVTGLFACLYIDLNIGLIITLTISQFISVFSGGRNRPALLLRQCGI